MPALVRSECTSLSNCAKAARTPSINLPVAVSSIGSVAERNEIPSDFNAVKRESHDDALLWRLRTRQQFQSCISRGLAAVGLERDPARGRSRYTFAATSEIDDAIR